MVNPKMQELGRVRSVIRDTFEYGRQRKAEIGEENVFDFSLGNPSQPPPPEVRRAILDLVETETDTYLHGYTSAQGDARARQAVAEDLNRRYGVKLRADRVYLTCGAAASLRIALTALICPGEGDEIITFRPFFPEYRIYVEAAGASLTEAETLPDSFQIDLGALESCLTEKTRAILVNSPNNPSGVVYRREQISEMADLLRHKQEEYGHPIYIICDEPYRELIYDESLEYPFMTRFYENTILCYSFSKSLSLPGERIGYIIVPDEAEAGEEIYAAVCGAGRALGYVCAPSLMQHVIARTCHLTADMGSYRKNRDLLYEGLTRAGFDCIYPDGAFYLFMKAPGGDAGAFCRRARDLELLLVPSDSFGVRGYVRISYCVDRAMIERALPVFERLAGLYGLKAVKKDR